MLINIGEEFVLSTDIVDDEYTCTVTFPISKRDFQLLLLDDGSLYNLGFVVDNDWRGEDE